jgi:hypothetical protein
MPDPSDVPPATLRFPEGEDRVALVRASFIAKKPPGVVCHALAIRLAKTCRELVDDFVPPDRWAEVDAAFHGVIKRGLKELWDGRLEP